MRDAYRYYDIDKKISRAFYLQYKVSDNAQCHECHEYKEVFDVCGTHNNMGICFDCLQKLIERGECPVCHKTSKMKPQFTAYTVQLIEGANVNTELDKVITRSGND